MTGRHTDRKKKEGKPEISNVTPAELFVLPDSLPTSEIDFPIIVNKSRKTANWNEILKESQEFQQSLIEHKLAKEPIQKCPFMNTESDYLRREVFTYLLPAIEQTLFKAKVWQVLDKPKSFFNGIDHIAQILWNNNPRYPQRKHLNLHIFNMPWARKILKEKPRELYPRSWLWPEEHAAIIIQKSVRQYFVQKVDEVQEMRTFWHKLELERQHPEVDTNPLLAKGLASSLYLRKLEQLQNRRQKFRQQSQQQIDHHRRPSHSQKK